MATSPIDVVTEGYLNSPLSVATDGYIYIATVGVIDKGHKYSGSAGKTRKVKGKSVAEIRKQLRQNEQIIEVVLAMIEQDII